METKTKLGQSPYFPAIVRYENRMPVESYQVGNYDANFMGMTQRRKIAADVLCALIKSGKYDIRLDVEGEAVYNHIVCKRALSITDTFLKHESE
jgi:hypothetical protein